MAYRRVLELRVEASDEEDADFVAALAASGLQRNWDGVGPGNHKIVEARALRVTDAQRFIQATSRRRFAT